MVAALGGATLRTGPGEVYSALEKGVADGAIYPVVPTLDFKLHEVTKFQVRPQVGELIEFLLVNLDSWNKLPKDLQNLITQTVQEMEEEGYKDLTVKGKASEDKLVASGLKVNPLPPAEAEKYEKAFYNPIMEEMIVKRSPDFGPRMKKAADTYRAK
jgi:TRAP-type C4-dicarboxylate transport system substrate-binding protein